MAEYKDKAIAEVKKVLTAIDDQLAKYPAAVTASQKTGVPASYLALGTAAVVILAILFGSGANALCNLVGYCYPVYASFKALKTFCQEDDTQWLTYWVAFGFVTLVDSFTNFFFKYLGAMYYFVKIALLLWLMLPQTRGAELLFNKVVLPIVNKYEQHIDGGLSAGGRVVDETKADVAAAGRAAAREGLKKTL